MDIRQIALFLSGKTPPDYKRSSTFHMMKLLQETDGAFYTDEKFKFMRQDAGSDEEFYVMVLDTLSRTGKSGTANAARDTDLLKRILGEYEVPKSFYETDAIEDVDDEYVEMLRKEGDELIQELGSIETGKENGADKKYEEFIGKAVRYLFEDSMTEPFILRDQITSHDSLDKRDWIMLNAGEHDGGVVESLWTDIVKKEFATKLIVIECKNYGDAINQEPMVTTNKYLHKPGYGRFCLMFTRKGAKEAGKTKLVSMYNGSQESKSVCMLVLSDVDVKTMIELKKKLEEPEKHLIEKYLELASGV